MSLIPSLVTLEKWPSGTDDRLVIWRPCRLGGSNPTEDKIFCNVHLFGVPLSWTGSVQMKSIMTFIRSNKCTERDEDIFKNGREVKRLKECALALTSCDVVIIAHVICPTIEVLVDSFYWEWN